MLGRRSQRDFEDEIDSHLQLEIDRLKAQGMSDTEATYAARKHFGNRGVAEDRYYEGRRFASFDDFMRDVRHALRGLLRTPAFLATSVVTLALAIGAVSGMLNVVNTVMLRPLPFANPDRLVFLEGFAPGSDLTDTLGLSDEFYVHYKEDKRLFSNVSTFISLGTSTFRAGDRVERIGMAWPTNDLYATLGVQPQVGRLPRAEDKDDAVVISDSLWRTWFNRDPAIVGKWYFVSDSMKQVVGVMPPGFDYPSDRTMLWVSGEIQPANVQPGGFGYPFIARVKDGVTEQQIVADIRQAARGMPARHGAPPSYVKVIDNLQPVVTPMLDGVLGPTVKASLYILLGAVALVLLIACANVANLFLVRAETRKRDLTVRRAVGASRGQLMRFQLTEAFVVAAIAGMLAVVLAAVALPIFVRSAPEGVPRLGQVHIDFVTVGVALGLVVLVALACGIAPAIRGSSPDLTGLRSGGRGNVGGRQWSRDALVVAQTALALMLLIGSALLLQSFNRLRNVDAGYDPKGIYTFQYAPQQPHLIDGPSLGQLHLTMMERFRALPGVTDVGVVNNIPLDEGTGGIRVIPEGWQGASDGIPLGRNFTGGDYFKAIGIRVLAGRTFTNQEAVTPNTSIIVSKSAAEKMWPGLSVQSAIGRQVRPVSTNPNIPMFTVVGVVNDVIQIDWRQKPDPMLYHPLTGHTPQAWGMGSPAYVLKSTRAEFLKEEVRKLIREVAPEAPVYREFTGEFLTRRYMLELSFTTLTLGALSVLALILGAVGLYGTLSYVVAQRTREIGVRMALGATARAVRSQVVAQGTKVVLVGAVIGIIAAYLTTKYLASLLYEVKPADPAAFAIAATVMIAMGVLASYMPARRASNVDPMEALRSD